MNKEIQLADYTIYIGDFQKSLLTWLEEKNYTQLFFFVDREVYRHWTSELDDLVAQTGGALINFPAGESQKNLRTCEDLWAALMNKNCDRSALIFNIGGGMTGDLGGFVASTYKRGVDFVQVPTTSLAMVDASLGGKLGINFNHIKNSIGVFKNPKAVFIDSRFLESLPERELKAGMAEVIKHALIFDAKLWEDLIPVLKGEEKPDWDDLIFRGVNIKKHFVENDPLEKGIRKALNFGHTIGHGLETYFLQSQHPLLHGEAVAMGMVGEAYISFKKGNIKEQDLSKISQLLQEYFLLQKQSHFDPVQIFPYMEKDKKNRGTEINFSLLNGIGNFRIDQKAETEDIFESFSYIQKTFQST
ncbi:MAG: 3-dehydroquinate synthase [Saprospiraceae bacterium]